ncbi:glycoside hydrolase family 9 protein [Auriscalpium vulgare]|uniref:Glycoside hydrolase family 9 protein n=1 Tax=Auriscalpium vulgare TaxID=40419 RepID=A0ACB8S994_9AGAM|nr:glycoside hydrolase family 9 protein [Auriscalpium vulgare]
MIYRPFLSCIFLSIPSVIAQLSLPSTPWQPPDASAGSQASVQAIVPNAQWATLLGNSLYFYEAQRSGHLPATKRVSWRNDSAVNDGADVNLDLSGGYYDAGDYIKATFPLTFTLMSICWGATDFGRGYDLANQTEYLDDMLRWGLDWLMKAHPSSTTLYVQVADANLDNAYWGGDVNLPTDRPSYQINNTATGTDAAAGAAAAFAACSALYSSRSLGSSFSSPASLQNSTYAATLLAHAQQLYSFALSGPQQTYQTAVPEAGTAYASSSFGDELAIAALFLAWAGNSSDAYADAQRWYAQYGLAGSDAVFNWDSKTPGVHVLFSQLALAEPSLAGNLSGWQAESERYFDNILNSQETTKGIRRGLLWYPGDSDDASLNPALNAAMLMTRYAQIATTPAKKSAYLSFAQNQVDYVLGNNPMSAPYVVGSNPNSPSNPHSAMASGGNDIGQIDTSPPQEAYVLYGAVVGGPDKKDRFYNIRSDWPETEVALDYNAPMLTLAAMHVLNDTSDPYYTRLQAGAYEQSKPSGQPCDPAFPCHSGLSSGAKIAIGVVVGLVGAVLLGLAGYYAYQVRKRRQFRY